MFEKKRLKNIIYTTSDGHKELAKAVNHIVSGGDMAVV